MALSILPYLMTTAAKKNHEDKEIVILTATSGDTGKAALAGFADVPGTRIIVFYPKDGVSAVQEKQMVTQKGKNTCVIGIRGNFDDAQTGVKAHFRRRGSWSQRAGSEAGFQLFFCKFDQYRAGLFRRSYTTSMLMEDCWQRVSCRAGEDDQCCRTDRQLWKYSGCFLCKADGYAGRQS